MFHIQAYACKCHVCGREFVQMTEFLSGPAWYLDDGRCVTMLSCNADSDGPNHPREDIRDAWLRRGRFATQRER